MTWSGEERREIPADWQDRLKRMEETLRQIHEAVFGNGKPERGFIVRMDRVERAMRVVIWAGGIVVVGCLGFAGWMVQQAFAKVFG